MVLVTGCGVGVGSVVSFITVTVTAPLLTAAPRRCLASLASNTLGPRRITRSRALDSNRRCSIVSPSRAGVVTCGCHANGPASAVLSLRALPSTPVHAVRRCGFGDHRARVLLRSAAAPVCHRSCAAACCLCRMGGGSLRPLSRVARGRRATVFSPGKHVITFASNGGVCLHGLSCGARLRVASSNGLGRVVGNATS